MKFKKTLGMIALVSIILGACENKKKIKYEIPSEKTVSQSQSKRTAKTLISKVKESISHLPSRGFHFSEEQRGYKYYHIKEVKNDSINVEIMYALSPFDMMGEHPDILETDGKYPFRVTILKEKGENKYLMRNYFFNTDGELKNAQDFSEGISKTKKLSFQDAINDLKYIIEISKE